MNGVIGRRVYPSEDGDLVLAEGDYGKDPCAGVWYARPPGEHMGSLANHQVTEHADGTITVSSSILITGYDGDCAVRWHGYLRGGVWTEC